MDAINSARAISIPRTEYEYGFSEDEINYTINLAIKALSTKDSFMDISLDIHDGFRNKLGDCDWITKADFKDRFTRSYYECAYKELRLTLGNVYIFIMGKQKIKQTIDWRNYWK